jgi:NADPH:quinone reductase-like Zn-dependent oxidoreductase
LTGRHREYTQAVPRAAAHFRTEPNIISSDFNFGIPELPYISGRELSGDIVQVGKGATDWRVGERVSDASSDTQI